MDYELITYGCSNTYGQALPDTWDEKNNQPIMARPSKFAWPQVLANQLKINCINRASPGVSSKEMWYNILRRNDYKENQIVIILWTYHNRFCFLENVETKKIFGHHDIDEWSRLNKLYQVKQLGTWWIEDRTSHLEKKVNSKIFFKHFYDHMDLLIDFYLRANHVQNYLHDKVKMVVHCWTNEDYDPIPHWNNIKFYDIWRYIDMDDKACDKSHPGIIKHENFATALYNEIIDEL